MRHYYAIGSSVIVSLAGIAIISATTMAACGTDAVGVDACRKIEEARCKRAPSCGISLANPPHAGSPGTDVDACISYYREACLHGLVRVAEPSSTEVSACIARIESGACDATQSPQSVAECAWLGTELGDAAASEASTDATDGTGDGSVDASADTWTSDVTVDAVTADVSND